MGVGIDDGASLIGGIARQKEAQDEEVKGGGTRREKGIASCWATDLWGGREMERFIVYHKQLMYGYTRISNLLY